MTECIHGKLELYTRAHYQGSDLLGFWRAADHNR